MSTLTPLQELLRSKMSDVSEDCYCAGWMDDTEYRVWQLIRGDLDHWGQCDRAEVQAQLDEIRDLADRIGFWIVWRIGDDDVTAVPIEEWRAAYDHGRKVAGL